MRWKHNTIMKILLVLIIALLCIGIGFVWKTWVHPHFVPSNDITMTDGYENRGSSTSYFDPNTGKEESLPLVPLTEAESAGEESIRVSITKKPLKNYEYLMTPSNHGDDGWAILGFDFKLTARRMIISVGTIIGVSEVADRGPMYVQVDICKDGEWIFGVKQEINAYEQCEIILPERSPYRIYLLKPEGVDWVAEYSYTEHWW